MTHPVDQARIEVEIREEKMNELLSTKTEKERQDILYYATLRDEWSAWCYVANLTSFRGQFYS